MQAELFELGVADMMRVRLGAAGIDEATRLCFLLRLAAESLRFRLRLNMMTVCNGDFLLGRKRARL